MFKSSSMKELLFTFENYYKKDLGIKSFELFREGEI